MKNHWLDEAKKQEDRDKIDELNRQWEEDLGWKNLDGERYARELTKAQREHFALMTGGGWGGWHTLFSPNSTATYPDSDKRIAFIDPQLPPLTDDMIMDEIMDGCNIGLNEHQRDMLKTFMKNILFAKQFAEIRREKTDKYSPYHAFRYAGDFENIGRYGYGI